MVWPFVCMLRINDQTITIKEPICVKQRRSCLHQTSQQQIECKHQCKVETYKTCHGYCNHLFSCFTKISTEAAFTKTKKINRTAQKLTHVCTDGTRNFLQVITVTVHVCTDETCNFLQV
jgi:hypothetical protein